MKMLKREKYLEKVRDFYDSDLIKVFTGIRRCGKSVLLKQIIEEIKNGKVAEEHIIYLNFEDINVSNVIKDSVDLNKYIEAKVVDNNSTRETVNNDQTNIFALLSFIFAMVGLLVAGMPCGIVAIVLGIIGLVTISKKPANNNKWMAITGLIVGILDVVSVGFLLLSRF